MSKEYNHNIPVDICLKLDEIRNEFGEDYTVILDEDGFGFTATTIEDEETGEYTPFDVEYHYSADIDDEMWGVFEEHKGMLPGCFWTDARRAY